MEEIKDNFKISEYSVSSESTKVFKIEKRAYAGLMIPRFKILAINEYRRLLWNRYLIFLPEKTYLGKN